MNPPQSIEKLTVAFEGDGDEIRRQLIYSGLLLIIFERFKEYIVDQVDGFFSDHVEIKDGDLLYTRGQEFKNLIREKGRGNPGDHNNTVFRAALYWFHDLGAITKAEFDDVERIYRLRNEIGHDLFRIVADDKVEAIALHDVVTAFSIYLKVVRWWIKEVMATTDPELDPDRTANFDDSESTDTMILRVIIRKALVGAMSDEDIARLVKSTADAVNLS
ncbi:MAG TPA: hypothetical protein VMB26_01685 [Candidatus Binataceae bacterium]|nr:hypothetical protein [Candidatus Binataceae bacterium]